MLGNPNDCEDTLKQVVALVAVSVVAVVSFVRLEFWKASAKVASIKVCCVAVRLA